MCKCTPEVRTPFCGKGQCVWPGSKPEGARSRAPQDVEEFIASESCYDPEHPKSSEHDYILVDDLRAWMAGHVRVPVEPTEEMAYAGIEVYGLEDCADADVHAVWEAMLNAAKEEGK